MNLDPSKYINCNFIDPLAIANYREAVKSLAYYGQEPYPLYNFDPVTSNWSSIKPLPVPPPYTTTIIDNIASFTYRGSVDFSVPNNEAANRFLKQIIKDNNLISDLESQDKLLQNVGTLVAKFSIDRSNLQCPIKIDLLPIPEMTQIFTSPHDHSKIILLRVQYPYQDFSDGGNWYINRIEYTDQQIITYYPALVGDYTISTPTSLPGYSSNFCNEAVTFEIETIVDNPLGLIPAEIIKNKSIPGSPYGSGTCWKTWGIQDEIALTRAQCHEYNQVSSNPQKVISGAEIDNTDELLPGEILSISSSDGDNPTVKLLEPHGNARQWVNKYADSHIAELYDMAGCSHVDVQSVTNTGQLTMASLAFMFQTTQATADAKRALWGASLSSLFEKLLIGCKKLGIFPELNDYSADQEVSVSWGDYYQTTATDRSTNSITILSELAAGIWTKAKAAEILATAQGIPPNEVQDIVDEAQGKVPDAQVDDIQVNQTIGSPDDVELEPLLTGMEFADSSDAYLP